MDSATETVCNVFTHCLTRSVCVGWTSLFFGACASAGLLPYGRRACGVLKNRVASSPAAVPAIDRMTGSQSRPGCGRPLNASFSSSSPQQSDSFGSESNEFAICPAGRVNYPSTKLFNKPCGIFAGQQIPCRRGCHRPLHTQASREPRSAKFSPRRNFSSKPTNPFSILSTCAITTGEGNGSSWPPLLLVPKLTSGLGPAQL